MYADQTRSSFGPGNALTMRPPVSPGRDEAEKKAHTHKHMLLCDVGASCGAGSMI